MGNLQFFEPSLEVETKLGSLGSLIFSGEWRVLGRMRRRGGRRFRAMKQGRDIPDPFLPPAQRSYSYHRPNEPRMVDELFLA